MKRISDESIRQALEQTTRQYLAGHLKKPQTVPHFHENTVEIGVTSYDEPGSEAPHYHTRAVEYMYLMRGMTQYVDLETEEEYTFYAGDFFQITPGTVYAQRSRPGTELLFIKTPPGNDKVVVEEPDAVFTWRQASIETTRTDYLNDPEAPHPNSVKPASAAALVNENEEILLVKRRDNEKWAMPGGTMEEGENLAACVKREVREETGYDIEVTGIVGTYTNPGTVIAYSDGEVRREFLILYEARITGGEMQLDAESSDYAWVSPSDAAALPMTVPQRQRVEDVKSFRQYGLPAFR
ncbi:NUDIX domain-containing protein [Salibacterium qingdaonense]|uniref:ADP-ribose pyrophosphatase YjhB, NUDIX family n=1 Tax=Salibacterium qingdaonense TaxID=266892 RepID=A0A1I4P1S8_9BACI|nr:NUDIX domain-containing protein [Salibacterium qingdaonense]SFM21313.1 ADP-ribose pyrophosphatase YjhB, NUDIX family [Salibacterium qingdaonense]